jgi:hypothetical protein
MKCKDVLELINSYIDDELDAIERESIESHLETCDSCRMQSETLRSTIAAIQSLDEFDVPADLSSALRNIIDSEKPDSAEQSPVQHVRFIPHFFRYATAIGAVAAIALVFFMTQNYRNTGALLSPEKLEQQDLRGLEESTKMAPNQSSNNSRNLLAGKDITQSKKEAPGKDQAEQQASSVARNMQETKEPQVTQDMQGAGGSGEAQDGITPNLTETNHSLASANPNAQDSVTLSTGVNENAKGKDVIVGATPQDQPTAAPNAYNAPPQNTEWPQVTSTATNYDRTAAGILLNKIFTDTKGLYTVGSAAQVKDWAINSIVEQIDAKNGNGESMRKPINALLDETKRDALPVYVEKAKFKGTDCWLIIIRWGFGDDRSELSKASLYITDSTGWKTLYYQSK